MILTDSERTILSEVINEIINAGFAEVSKQQLGFNRWYWDKKSDGCFRLVTHADSGVSKGCFFCKLLPGIVIKTPILKEDYCKKELDNYYKAIDSGFERFFAEIEFFGEINGIQFYIQVAADNNKARDSLWNSASESFPRYLYETEDEYCCAVNEFLEEISDEDRVETFFGEIPKGFIEFLWTNEINDLHEGNIGLIGERRVIFDYSGW